MEVEQNHKNHNEAGRGG